MFSVLYVVLFLDADGERLREGVAPSFQQDFMTAVDGVYIGSRVGSYRTAAYRKETVIVSNIQHGPSLGRLSRTSLGLWAASRLVHADTIRTRDGVRDLRNLFPRAA